MSIQDKTLETAVVSNGKLSDGNIEEEESSTISLANKSNSNPNNRIKNHNINQMQNPSNSSHLNTSSDTVALISKYTNPNHEITFNRVFLGNVTFNSMLHLKLAKEDKGCCRLDYLKTMCLWIFKIAKTDGWDEIGLLFGIKFRSVFLSFLVVPLTLGTIHSFSEFVEEFNFGAFSELAGYWGMLWGTVLLAIASIGEADLPRSKDAEDVRWIQETIIAAFTFYIFGEAFMIANACCKFFENWSKIKSYQKLMKAVDNFRSYSQEVAEHEQLPGVIKQKLSALCDGSKLVMGASSSITVGQLMLMSWIIYHELLGNELSQAVLFIGVLCTIMGVMLYLLFDGDHQHDHKVNNQEKNTSVRRNLWNKSQHQLELPESTSCCVKYKDFFREYCSSEIIDSELKSKSYGDLIKDYDDFKQLSDNKKFKPSVFSIIKDGMNSIVNAIISKFSS